MRTSSSDAHGSTSLPGEYSPLDRRAGARFVLQGNDITRELQENLERLTLDIPDVLPRASLDIVCMRYLLKADSFRILYGDFFLKSYMLQMRSHDLIFCKHIHIYIYIYIYIYRLLPGVYMSQMVNVFSMSFTVSLICFFTMNHVLF